MNNAPTGTGLMNGMMIWELGLARLIVLAHGNVALMMYLLGSKH